MEDAKKNLFYRSKSASELLTESEMQMVSDFCKGYKSFLDSAKTERETVSETIRIIMADGFTPYSGISKLLPGGRVYYNHHGKALILLVHGQAPMEEGLSIVAAHIDSPRLDLKVRPLYENGGFAYFDTHYYGGIKAYQWTSIPLALHGTVIRKDGTALTLKIGEDKDDPVFFISDLLPHLAGKQMELKGEDLVKGEDLNILAGSYAYPEEKAPDSIKLNILSILNQRYGICEEDLISAELEAVPAFSARDLGLDRSLIAAYGQDDRICAYPALIALLALKQPEYTSVLILADKEETGSYGDTGMQSAFFRDFIQDLALAEEQKLHRILANSICLSADVIAGYDPVYAEVFDRQNAAALNYGVVLSKYRGHRGKINTVDASAELISKIRKILNDADVLWQIGEGGKIDAGGGSTLAKFVANLNIPTIDMGLPILSMHAPFEASSKTDIYMMYRALDAFWRNLSR